MPPKKVTIRVPATTANMGPGFDCLGMALDIFNTLTVEVADSFSITLEGDGPSRLSKGKDNLVYKSIEALYAKVGKPVPHLRIHCNNVIPLSRGLGSSSAAIVGGMTAANILLGNPLSRDDILDLAVFLEGHPDNVTSALCGGCNIVVMNGIDLVTTPVPLKPGVKAVLYIPDFEMPTLKARALLHPEVSRADAVFNIGRAAMLAVALSSGRWDLLKVATQDRLHQPQRQTLFPAMGYILQAALDAGAPGAFLSGSGSTVLAIATTKTAAIGKAMADTAKREGLSGKTLVTKPSPVGVQALEVGLRDQCP